jgi:hypothetical protein
MPERPELLRRESYRAETLPLEGSERVGRTHKDTCVCVLCERARAGTEPLPAKRVPKRKAGR